MSLSVVSLGYIISRVKDIYGGTDLN